MNVTIIKLRTQENPGKCGLTITTRAGNAGYPLRPMRRNLIGIVPVLAVLLLLSIADVERAHAQTTVPPWPEIGLEPVTESVLGSALHVTHAGDGSGRLFVAEKSGLIYVLSPNQDGGFTRLAEPFLNIRDRVADWSECGLLSTAFPADFADQGYFFVYYSYDVDTLGDLVAPEDEDLPNNGCDTVVARFRLTDDPNVADPDSEERLLIYNQPYGNHNGGQIAFGPDGMLYVGLGDGGSGGDPHDQAQTPDTLLGKLLRIEAGAGGPYTVPADNPFVDDAAYRPEIWGLGLRNPWRFSFDAAAGDLYIADVGQSAYEEINVQPWTSSGGENYGWKQMEGLHCYPSGSECDTDGLTLPVVEYDHAAGQSVTGGHVYRGGEFPRLNGIYFYADYVNGKLWGLRRQAAGWDSKLLLETDLTYTIVSFGTGEDDTLYVVGLNGVLYRLVDSGDAVELPYALYLPTVRR